jgi:hypothetical protein
MPCFGIVFIWNKKTATHGRESAMLGSFCLDRKVRIMQKRILLSFFKRALQSLSFSSILFAVFLLLIVQKSYQ